MDIRKRLALVYAFSHALNDVPKVEQLHFLTAAPDLDSVIKSLAGQATVQELTRFRAAYFSYLRSSRFTNEPLDALILFTGGQRQDGPTVLSLQRGLKLLEGLSVHPGVPVVLSGGYPLLSSNYKPAKSDAALLEEYLRSISPLLGIDTDGRFLKDEASKETMGNGLFSYFMLKDAGIDPKRVGLITNDEHLGRAEMTMQIDWNGACMVPELAGNEPHFFLENRNRHVQIRPYGVPSLGRVLSQSEQEALEAIYFARYIGLNLYGSDGIWASKYPAIHMVREGKIASAQAHELLKSAYETIVCGPGVSPIVLREYRYDFKSGRIVLGESGQVRRAAAKESAGMEPYMVR